MPDTLDSSSIHMGSLVCKMVENHLQCIDLHTQEKKHISIDDIVCILPDSSQNQIGYRVLFLQTDSECQRDHARLESIQVASLPSKLLSRYLCTELPHHLNSRRDQKVDIHVVISTLSGTGLAKSIFQNALEPFLFHLGLTDYNVHETQSTHTIMELARLTFLARAKAGVSQTIILLSGDGGLVDLIDVFYNSAETAFVLPNIALIPTGTGNAMANSTGLLSHSTSAFTTLLQGKPVPIPSFSANFSPGARYTTDEGRGRATIGTTPKVYGAVVVSWGIHASLVADSDTAEYRKFGADRFKMAAKELLFPSSGAETHEYNGEIALFKLDQRGKPYVSVIEHSKHMYVLAVLVSSLESNFLISPQSIPLDGQLRLVHFGPIPPEEAMRLMGLAYQGGQHVHEKAVTYTQVEGLRIDFHEADEKWRRVCVDGKIIVVEQGGWVEVRKEPRRLLNLITCVS
ncbi:hypothetical protein ASPWEDRAFT_155913 [Aspergillus wentii DTO 134E9]|uniref:DAGKc domain-containing protein n=1 Tax=Aspergillus wentii DTO 134E9 TaxID=1073089 RepID=A0A1L9RLN9_ASPWE|nr:uncharacterized protein ASPWEDRAFT_155913 [Aspergillus wentii DTO 134E9]OJJ35748.1 hypothetical protein ASPWEDRAFT_155913 [Aspergillus wentii DTO 134E9]